MTAIAISAEKIHITIQVRYASLQKKLFYLIASVQTIVFFPNAAILADEIEASKLTNYYLCIMVTWL